MFIGGFFIALHFGVLRAESRNFMLNRHERVAKEHFFLPALHNRVEVVGEAFAEARRLALFADRLADTVGATTDFYKDSR